MATFSLAWIWSRSVLDILDSCLAEDPDALVAGAVYRRLVAAQTIRNKFARWTLSASDVLVPVKNRYQSSEHLTARLFENLQNKSTPPRRHQIWSLHAPHRSPADIKRCLANRFSGFGHIKAREKFGKHFPFAVTRSTLRSGSPDVTIPHYFAGFRTIWQFLTLFDTYP